MSALDDLARILAERELDVGDLIRQAEEDARADVADTLRRLFADDLLRRAGDRLGGRPLVALAGVADGLHPLNDHPLPDGSLPTPWGEACWKVFLNDDADIRRSVKYVRDNLAREGRGEPDRQAVVGYDGARADGGRLLGVSEHGRWPCGSAVDGSRRAYEGLEPALCHHLR